jgi:GT2 family glycosyltransferase
MALAMDVTIIIATYDRSRALVYALDSVKRAAEFARPLMTELIVVANASPNDTPDVARAWAETAGFPVRVLEEPRQGACRARNLGITEARGRIMAITDDDCRLAEDYIVRLVAAHDSDPIPTLRGGRLELGDASDLPMTVKTELDLALFEPPVFPGGFLHGCNFTFTRPVVERVGFLDTRFGPGTAVGAAEDTDYLFRAWKLGVPVVYDPSIVIYHHHGRNQVNDVARLFRTYNRADGAFYAKHALASPGILKNFYWDVRNAVMEPFGGKLFNTTLGFRHGPRVCHTILGALAFATSKTHDESPAPGAPQGPPPETYQVPLSRT